MPSASAFRRERPRRARRRSAHANRPAPWCRPNRVSAPAENRSRRPARWRTPQEPSSASSELVDGASVHGRSTTRLDGNKDRGAAQQRARRRRHRIETLEAAAEDGAARHSRWSQPPWQSRPRAARRGRPGPARRRSGRCRPSRRRRRTAFAHVTGSWRVRASVRKNAKIGEVELRMVASPASSARSAQAISVHGITLLRQAWNRKRRQVAASFGNRSPRPCMIASSSRPAIDVRAAIRVTGGIVATPSLMKVYDPPHSVASSRSSASSTAMAGGCGPALLTSIMLPARIASPRLPQTSLPARVRDASDGSPPERRRQLFPLRRAHRSATPRRRPGKDYPTRRARSASAP